MRNLTKTGAYISAKIGKAIADYNLIEDKDRILVAVSGGKDSLALLHLLNERKRWAPIHYDLIAVHIETDYRCAGCMHTKTLKKLFEEKNIPYHFEKIKILSRKKPLERSSSSRSRDNFSGEKLKTSCFWCSWNRRKALFTLADKYGCTKIAFGHHKDDIIETLLLNIFYHGEFSAMNPRQELFNGKIVIIRPLCYVEEASTRRFAKEMNFPAQLCRCPNAETSKRRMMKNMIQELEKGCSFVKTNIFKSIARINKEYIQIEHETAPEEEMVGASK